MLDALASLIGARNDSCGPPSVPPGLAMLGAKNGCGVPAAGMKGNQAQFNNGKFSIEISPDGTVNISGNLSGKGASFEPGGSADVGGGHCFDFEGDTHVELADGTQCHMHAPSGEEKGAAGNGFSVSINDPHNGHNLNVSGDLGDFAGGLDIQYGNDGFNIELNGGFGQDDKIPEGCAGKVDVGVDHCGHATDDSIISILKEILQALIKGDLDEVLQEAGLEGCSHPEHDDQLQFNLGEANKIADSAVPEGGLSDDAMQVVQALREMLDGLTRLVEDRLDSFGWGDDFRALNQTAQHNGLNGSGSTFDIHIHRAS